MSQKSTPLAQRKRFAKFANQLEKGIPPSEEQTRWLIGVFSALSHPNPETDRVLGLKYGPGQSYGKEQAASKMDFIMHWIAGAISPDTSHLRDPNDASPPMGIEEAIGKAAEVAKLVFDGDHDSSKYDREYIKKCWYDKDKHYRQEPYRNAESHDTYYQFPID